MPPPTPRVDSSKKKTLVVLGVVFAGLILLLVGLVFSRWDADENRREAHRGERTATDDNKPDPAGHQVAEQPRDVAPPSTGASPSARLPGESTGPTPRATKAQPVENAQDVKPAPATAPSARPAESKPAELKDLFAQLAPSVPLVLVRLDERRLGHGSGFVIQHAGDWYVATNNHVVEYAAKGVELFFLNDKGKLLHRTTPGQVRIVRMSKEADVALIDCNRIVPNLRQHDIQPVRLAPRDYQPSVGEKVFAIGHPSAGERDILPQTLTEGIVSGVGRRFNDPMLNTMRFIQTTASVNPGNSGGPLFDFTGRVVGINTLVIRRSPKPDLNLEGLNFALEVRHLHDLLDNPDLSFTELEIEDMLQRRMRRPGRKPVELKPELRKIVEQEVIIGAFQQQRFTFRLGAGETVVMWALPVGVDVVRMTLNNPRGQIVAQGIQTLDNPAIEGEAREEGVYTLWVANPNFIPAVVRVVAAVVVAP